VAQTIPVCALPFTYVLYRLARLRTERSA
jgi:hypothetical protein